MRHRPRSHKIAKINARRRPRSHKIGTVASSDKAATSRCAKRRKRIDASKRQFDFPEFPNLE